VAKIWTKVKWHVFIDRRCTARRLQQRLITVGKTKR